MQINSIMKASTIIISIIKMIGIMINMFILSVIVLIQACVPSSEKSDRFITINVADNIGTGYMLNISDIAESIQYIPLETNITTVVGDIDKIWYKNGMFIFNTLRKSNGILSIYDSTGKYYNTLNRFGRGPDEYSSVFSVDVYDRNLILLTGFSIKEYTPEGRLLKTIPLEKSDIPSGFLRVIKLDDNQYLLATKPGFRKDHKYSGIIVDSLGKTIITFPYPESEKKIDQKKSGTVAGGRPIIFSQKGAGKIITGNNEFIVSYNKEQQSIDTVYRVNFGKYNITEHNLNPKEIQKNLIYLLVPILESENFIFMTLNLSSLAHKPTKIKTSAGNDVLLKTSCALFDKRETSFRLIDQPADYQIGFVDDIEGGPAFWPQYVSDDDYMVSFINASEFIDYTKSNRVSDKLKRIANNLKISDNPVIILAKLKKN